MPNWKKVIVSGSNASLNSITASSGATITGSVNISGSTTQIGSNNLFGNTSLSGSLTISGSQGSASPTINIFGDVNQTGYTRYLPVTSNIDTSISASYIYVSGSTNDLYFSQNGNGYANTTRLRWLEGNLYTGLLNGGLITIITGSTTFNLSSGSGIVVDLNASLNDNPYPTIKYVNWDNFTSQPITFLTSSIQSYIGIDENGQITQQTTPFTDGEYNTKILIGTVLHQNKTTVNASITYPNVAYGYKQRSYDFIKAFGPLKLSGYTINPSSSLGLTIGGGTAFADGRNYQVDPNNPSYITDPGTTVSKIFRYYQSGSEFVQDTNGGLGYTVIDPANYNNNGTLTSVSPSTPFTIQRVFWYPNSATKGIVVYYGNAQYSSISEAASNLNFETFSEVENTKQNAVYLGAIIIRYNGVFTNTADYSILPAGIFRSVGGSGGGGSTVTTRLVDLSDVNISGPTDYQALIYNGTSLKWQNASFISASISGNAQTATTASYALTSSNVLGGTQYYIPNWNTNTSLGSSYLYQSGSILKTIFSNQDRGLTLDYNTNSFILGNPGVGNNTYLQIFDGGSTINVYSPNYTYFNDKIGVRIIPTNPGLAVSGALEVTGPGTSKFMNSNVQITGSLDVNGSITGSLLGTASYASNADLLDGLNSTAFAQLALTNRFTANQIITGSLTATGDIITQGNIVAQQYIISSSVAYFTESFSSGSTNFGNSLDDTHKFTGSVLITGSSVINGPLVVGSGSAGSGENTLVVGVAPNGGVGEGGQILLSAVGGTYTSASMLDVYQDKFRILRGTNVGSDAYKFQVDLHSGQIQTPNYNSLSAFPPTGMSTKALLGVDSSGFILTTNSISGSLGVGTTGSAIYGRIDASNDVVAFSTSDSRLKTNITLIEKPLEKITQIGGYTFDWNPDPDLIKLHGFEGQDIGVIAEEIEKVLPEVVTTRDSGYKAVKYEKIVPLLIEAIKELKAEVDRLKSGNYNNID